ncbi:hypothetical protein H1W37_19505 [Stappia taiwanensis]|uniref:Uncharacterized protein n=1 Tax=Stappia taiwanensis TaxID=992267 RepID=A0A838Y4T3_9HYPH|nr:hypothetical protein [Stappia taiwanensis]MBA4613850.1 hypothetical protein [Stappia taiwanensis]GGE79025.1 hypothetical protein GCM10007285_03580 [Stappia taiwanensis]
MSFSDCLISAVEQGALSREEAQALNDDFDARFAEARMSLGDEEAARLARERLSSELKMQAIEKRRRAALMERARQRLKGELIGYRDEKGRPDVFEAAMGVLSHYGYRGYSSIRGRSEAIIMLAQGRLNEAMWHWRRGAVTGMRHNLADIEDLVKDLHGEPSGNETAAALAQSISEVFEDLRQRFNAAGGAIAKLKDFGLPHTHDGLKMRKAGGAETIVKAKANWIAKAKEAFDFDRSVNPLTGEPIGDAGADRFLDRMFDQVTTEGWAHMEPSLRGTGKGALASQRQDARILVAKSPAHWQSYNAEFGTGDVIETIFNHINSMAKDIAAMETLGPNPDAMLEWMIQNVRREVAVSTTGAPSLARETGQTARWATGTQPGSHAEWRLRGLYAHLRGRPVAAAGVATLTANVKNVMNSALLGSASIVAAATDPFVEAMSKKLAGLPVMRDVGGLLKTLSAKTRKEVLRDGAIWDEYLQVMEAEARFAGLVLGSNWSKYMVDRSMMAFGLKPITSGRRIAHARSWHAALADMAGNRLEALPERLRAALEGFGITADDWDIMRDSVDDHGFITPSSIMASEGRLSDLAEQDRIPHRLVAEKYAELIASWTERAVPSGTPNARSWVTGSVERGTPLGEFADFGLQFKSFGLSLTTLQIEAMTRIGALDSAGRFAAPAYFAQLAIGLTIGGAIAIQIKNLADGKDLEEMDPRNSQFWVRAAFQGGGFGLLGDFASASSNRFGGGVASSFVGPGLNFGSDLFGLTVGNALEGARGEKTNAGREAVNFAGRYTPVLSSWWATRAAYRRMVLDQLQWMVDPGAAKSFKARQQNLKRRTGQEYWWEPGDASPDRAPGVAARP